MRNNEKYWKRAINKIENETMELWQTIRRRKTAGDKIRDCGIERNNKREIEEAMRNYKTLRLWGVLREDKTWNKSRLDRNCNCKTK